jgi:hypothetical protein
MCCLVFPLQCCPHVPGVPPFPLCIGLPTPPPPPKSLGWQAGWCISSWHVHSFSFIYLYSYMAYLHSTRPQGKTESFLSILHVLATTYPSFKPFVDTFKSPTLDPPYWQSDGMSWWGLGLTDEDLYGMVLLSGACTLAHIVHWSSYPISIPHSHYPIPLTRQLVIN